MKINEIQEIIIDPRFKVNYASYYLYGIKLLLGSSILKYRCLADIDIETDRQSRIGFAMMIVTAIETKRVYIDYGDWSEVNEAYYGWADVYAKANVLPKDASRSKMLVIGPSFGVRLWNPVKCMLMGVKNYRKIKESYGSSYKRTLKQYMMDYGYMFMRRKRYEYYHRFSDEEQSDYCFSFNTLWYDQLSYNTTNKHRGDFIRQAQKLMNRFEGGFIYLDGSGVLKEFPKYEVYLQEYGDLIYKKRLSMSEYDKRNRRSCFVFNTPSVAGCHGWKLVEYLCEGKAIISTRLTNLMPMDFKNGTHYIEANTPDEMAGAIVKLRDNGDLVQQLKQNAFQYFNDVLAPEVVMKRIFNRALCN